MFHDVDKTFHDVDNIHGDCEKAFWLDYNSQSKSDFHAFIVLIGFRSIIFATCVI